MSALPFVTHAPVGSELASERARLRHRWVDALLSAILGLDTGTSPAPAPAPEDEVRAWVGAAQGGDTGAAQRIYRAYVARVFRAVRPLCRDEAEAEDVTQETFARALEALDTYRPRAGVRFLSWLLAIGMNVARKSLRRRRRIVVTEPSALSEGAEEIGSDDPSGEELDRRRLRAALLHALEALDEREREVVSLRYGGELSASEVAELTGLAHANVRKILQRARERLRAEIERLLAASRASAEAETREEGSP